MSIAGLPVVLIAVLVAYLVGRSIRPRFVAAIASGTVAVVSVLAIYAGLFLIASASDRDTVPSEDSWWTTVILFTAFLGVPLFLFGAVLGWLGASTPRAPR